MINFFITKFHESFSAKKIQSLDGIRAISCLFVIIGHFSYLYAPALIAKFGNTLGETLTFMIGNQYTGVTFFFVLSGFLITNLLIIEIKKTDKVNFKNFFIKRVFRIFPAYYFYFAFILIWIRAFKLVSISNQDIVAIVTYTYNYLSLLNPWHTGHFWSLSVEEQFYLLWPVMFLLTFKKINTRLPWGIILFSPVLRILTYVLFPSLRARISILTHTRFDALMFGCLLAYYYHMGKFNFFNDIIKKYRLQFIGAFHVFCFSRFLQIQFEGKYLLPVGYSLDCFFMCILIIYAIENKSLVTKILNLPILVHLGTLSYSLYLWQMPFTWSQLGASYILPRIVGIYLCALFSYLVIECPFMHMREKYFKHKQAKI